MKATLEFDTNQPEDNDELRRCLKALDYGFLIQDMSEYLWRNLEKDTPDIAEAIHKKFEQLCTKYDITPGEYIT